jgi:hypothetical protein
MATTNAALTTAWTQVAADSDDPVLLQLTTDLHWEVAAVATETAPTVTGHLVTGAHQQVSRAVIGDGYLYARMRAGAGVLVVTK